MCGLVRLLDTSGVDYIEVGYLDDDPVEGLAARCPATVLEQMHAVRGKAMFAAMLRSTVSRPREVLESRTQFLDLIRIPTHAIRLGASLDVAEVVSELGLRCSINLTNVSIYREDEIVTAVDSLRSAGCVSVIYLADSRGALRPAEVGRLVDAVRDHWEGPLGFHAHDNLGLALTNTMQALNHGCTWADGSVDRLGQGVGNAPLQTLIRMRGASRRVDLRVLSEFADRLEMPERGRLLDVYRLTGEKNVSQDWVPTLYQKFGTRLSWLLRVIPRSRYATEDRVVEALSLAEEGLRHSG